MKIIILSLQDLSIMITIFYLRVIWKEMEKRNSLNIILTKISPTVDLYKAAHHGSKTSSTMDFLNLIQPKMCVVSCSAGNPEYTSNYLNVFPTQTFVSNISKFTDKVMLLLMEWIRKKSH